jgi:hypothetical protein
MMEKEHYKIRQNEMEKKKSAMCLEGIREEC